LNADGRAKVREAAAGNPLFAEEMVALVEASGGGEVRVPATIQALLAARLDQLDPAELRTLERGSVEGQSFHRSALAALAPDDAELSRRLLGLVRKDLLRPDHPTLGRDDAFRFRHMLLRDAAYDRLPKSARAQLHERFARWLDEQAADLAERDHLVGYHLEQAYRYRAGLGPVDDDVRRLATEAAERLEVAGRREMARSDLGGAIDLLDRASALAPREKPDVSLELGLASSLQLCGRPADAVTRAGAAAEAAAAAGDELGAMCAELGQAGLALAIGAETASGLQRKVDAVLPRLEAAGDDAALAWGYWAVAQIAHNACRFGDSLDAGLKMQMYAERSRDPFLSVHVAQLAAAIAMGPTPAPRALEMLEELRDRDVGYDPWIDEMRSGLLLGLGRIDEARRMHEEVLAAFRDRGMELSVGIAGQQTWEIAMVEGDLEAAVAAGRDSCVLLDAMGERGWMSTNAAQLAEALYLLGRDDEAQQWMERSLEVSDPDDAVTQAQARMVRALLTARRGDAEAARRDVDDVLSIIADMQAPQFQGDAALNAASVLASIGDTAAAEEQARHALEFYAAKGSTVDIPRAEAALAAISSR
jgi:tetratricopeptide (TPR) repeat protein